MNPSALLAQVTSPEVIRSHFDWLRQQGVPLLLLNDAVAGHRPVRIVDFDTATTALHVVCDGMPDFSAGMQVSYAAIGATPMGAHFLASGQMGVWDEVPGGFKLSVPNCIDVAQSRGEERRPVPVDHVLHFCAIDPHLNDVVCRVQNISSGGLAVEWTRRCDLPPPELGSMADPAILHVRDQRLHLGSLRVAHISSRKECYSIGLQFVQAAPSAFDTLVRDAQQARALG